MPTQGNDPGGSGQAPSSMHVELCVRVRDFPHRDSAHSLVNNMMFNRSKRRWQDTTSSGSAATESAAASQPVPSLQQPALCNCWAVIVRVNKDDIVCDLLCATIPPPFCAFCVYPSPC